MVPPPLIKCGHCFGRRLCECYECVADSNDVPRIAPCEKCGGSGMRDDEIRRADDGGYVRYWVGKSSPKWPVDDWRTAFKLVQELNRRSASAGREEQFRVWREEINLMDSQASCRDAPVA